LDDDPAYRKESKPKVHGSEAGVNPLSGLEARRSP